MKKIGIITFHSTINYGVFLQAFALQKSLMNLGFDVEILDYTKMIEENTQIAKRKTIFYRILHLKRTIWALKLLFFRFSSKSKNRQKLFAEFSRSYFKLSSPCDSFRNLKDIEGDYDFFVCGSDQIWNPSYTKGNPVYFLAFAKPQKRVMYAPSYGVKDISLFRDYQSVYNKLINELHGLSVRETSGVSLTEQLSGRTPTVVVDPTLLISSNEWEKIEKRPENTPDNYILFYVLGNDKRYNELAAKFFAETKMQIIAVPTVPIWNKKNVMCVYAGIENFLYLVHHAKYVVTDSFHGVAFSTIFKKDFIAIKREDTEHSLLSRIEDYLGKVGLINNCMTVSSLFDQNKTLKTDYTDFDRIFPEWKNASLQYLKTSLFEKK